MVDLFVSDIDGCLAEPYAAYNLEGFEALGRHAAAEDPASPALSICSGRSYPYVEAVTQALGLTVPVLFESGGGRFDPVAAQTTWNPALTDDIEAALEEVRHWFVTECVPGTALSLDHAKRTQAGVVSPRPEEIVELRPRTEQFVEEHVPDLRVFATAVSIDVVPPGITKQTGLEWLTDHLDLDMKNVAYIGDTESDLEALAAVGHSFAPANADAAVREQVDHVTDGTVLDGTLAAYQYCRTQNGS